MKLSNQNIYHLRGCKNFWGWCQMPLGGANHFCTPHLPAPPRKSVPDLFLANHHHINSLNYLHDKKVSFKISYA
jgi:hypothetical protein